MERKHLCVSHTNISTVKTQFSGPPGERKTALLIRGTVNCGLDKLGSAVFKDDSQKAIPKTPFYFCFLFGRAK